MNRLTTVIAGAVIFLPTLASAEQLDILNCRSGTITPLHVVAPGTFQSCNIATGEYTLRK